MSIYIRRLRATDLSSVIQIARWLHENSRYRVFPFNEAKVRQLLSVSLTPNSPVYVSVAILKGSDEILGYFHGFVDEHYFSNAKYAADFAVCVLPQHRRHAPQILRLMFQSFEAWAKGNGADEISIGASTEACGTGYQKLLNRLGYRDVGFLAVKG